MVVPNMAMIEKWIEKLAESLDCYLGETVRKRIMSGSEQVEFESTARVRNERNKWLKKAMDELDAITDEKTRCTVLVDTCPHIYPKSRIKTMKSKYEKLGSIDKLLEFMRADTSWRGGSYYDYPVRIGDMIYVTKVPYQPSKHKNAKTDLLKRRAYCHCSWIRKNREVVSPTFCCCSGGWVKQLWEGVLGIPLEVELSESLLSGDERCTHVFQIPSDLL